MEVFTAATLAALIWKFTSTLKYASAGEVRNVITQIIPWVAGIAAVWIAAQAEVANTLNVWGDMPLSQLDGWSIVLAGIALGSAGSVGYDVKKAFDGTDSAREPELNVAAPDRTKVAT